MFIFNKKSVSEQIKDILQLAEEQEVKCLIKYKRDGYTFVLSNDNKSIDIKSLENAATIKRGRKKEE